MHACASFSSHYSSPQTPTHYPMSSECNYAFSRLLTAIGKVKDGHWRRYFIVFSIDSYRDAPKLSCDNEALVDHLITKSLLNVPLHFVPAYYLPKDYACMHSARIKYDFLVLLSVLEVVSLLPL